MHTSKFLINTTCVAIGLCLFAGLAGTTSAGDIRLKDKTGCWLTWQQLAEQLPDSIEGYTVVGEDHVVVNDSIELSEDDHPAQVWARRTYFPKNGGQSKNISLTLSCGSLLTGQLTDLSRAAKQTEKPSLKPTTIHDCEGYSYGNPDGELWERIELGLIVEDIIGVRITGPGTKERSCVPRPHEFAELTRVALALDFVALDSLAEMVRTPSEEVAEDSVLLDDYVEEEWENCYLDWEELAAFMPKLPERFKTGPIDYVQSGDRESSDSGESFDVMASRDYVYKRNDSVVVRVIISCGATWTHTARQWLTLAESADSDLARKFDHYGNPAYLVLATGATVKPTRVIGVLINDMIGLEIQGMKASSFEELWFYFAHIDFLSLRALTHPARTPWERKEPR